MGAFTVPGGHPAWHPPVTEAVTVVDHADDPAPLLARTCTCAVPKTIFSS